MPDSVRGEAIEAWKMKVWIRWVSRESVLRRKRGWSESVSSSSDEIEREKSDAD